MSDENDTLSDRLFDGGAAESELEDQLDAAGMSFSKLGWDHYDCSIELYGVDPLHRLSKVAQEVIYKAGFRKAFVNHTDHWETHYDFDQNYPFSVSNGWRVSYPGKRNDDPDYKGSIWVEQFPQAWPKDWLSTGYVQIKPPNYTENPHDAVSDTVPAPVPQHAGGGTGGFSRYTWLTRWLVFLATGKICRGVPLR